MEEMGGAGQIYDVIRIDLNKLRSGDLTQNIIIQSGDDIQVPYNSVGVFYVGGQVSRPGAYNLTGAQMTLKRAMVSAGPLTSLAWPSRCEISRMIGENREVTYQVNLEKLFTGTAPDIYIKPGDMINVGSHPLARFIAVVRQSFRATYGFGFVYDRNFADKDFGH
jgi:protein involved in polysaccharide export with SLBB domain